MSEIRKIGAEGRVAPVTDFPQQTVAPPATAAPLPPPAAKKTRGRFTRPLLLFGVPLLVVLGLVLRVSERRAATSTPTTRT